MLSKQVEDVLLLVAEMPPEWQERCARVMADCVQAWEQQSQGTAPGGWSEERMTRCVDWILSEVGKRPGGQASSGTPPRRG